MFPALCVGSENIPAVGEVTLSRYFPVLKLAISLIVLPPFLSTSVTRHQ